MNDRPKIVRCFLLEQTSRVNRYLRRFTYHKDAPCESAEGESGHDSWELLDQVENPAHGLDDEEKQELAQEADENNNLELLRKFVRGDLWPHDDGRWPETCQLCGYPFGPSDEWQLHQKDVWVPANPSRAPDGLEETELRNAPPGAMWDAYWMPHSGGEDGRCLVVKTPDEFDWVIDGPATNNQGEPGWERQGDPPRITVRPSIGTPDYHGFLIDGEFTADIEGRSYDGE